MYKQAKNTFSCIFLLTFFLISLAARTLAADPTTPPPLNLQFVAPPLPAASFASGKNDIKKQFLLVQTRGEDFNLKGGAANFAWRAGINDGAAMDFQLGLVAAGGTVNLGEYGPKSGSFFTALNLQTDVEFQIVNVRSGSLVAYGGFVFPFSWLIPSPATTYTDPQGDEYNLSPQFCTIMYGVPMGLKASVNIGKSIQVAPSIGLINYFGGKTYPFYWNWTTGYYTEAVESMNIDPFISTSAGVEVTVRPWDFSAGILVQRSPASRDARDGRAYNLGVTSSFGYVTWHFGASGILQ